MDKRMSVEVSEESYLDLLARGCRSGYLRLAVDNRLIGVRKALATLRGGRADEEIMSLLDDASGPAARIQGTRLALLSLAEMTAVSLLWSEEEATGLGGALLLEALDSKRVS